MESKAAASVLDGFPISKGHCLVVPKRHVASLFELPGDEMRDVWALVERTRKLLRKRFRPDGFNVGVNDGIAAGQTVAHAHVHLIPRYKGDVADPRGGIRWVIPAKAKYW